MSKKWFVNTVALIFKNNGKIIIAAVDGSLTVKRLVKKGKNAMLSPENSKYKPIKLTENNDIIIWGVVTNVIHKV